MPLINGYKYSCGPCIRGHRATSCAHTDRILTEVRKPGRPLETCGHQLDTCSCGRVQDALSLGGVSPGSNQLLNLIPQSQAISQAPPHIPKAKPRRKSDSKISKRTSKKKGIVVQPPPESPTLALPSSASFPLPPMLPTVPQVPPQFHAQPQGQIWTPVPNPSPASMSQNTVIPYQPQQRVDQRVAYQSVHGYGVQSRVEDIDISGSAERRHRVGQEGQPFIRSQYFPTRQNEGWGSIP